MLPYTITAGTKAKASEVQGNDSNLDLRLVSVETMIENLTVDANTYGNGVFPDGLTASQIGTTLVYSTGGLICNHVYYNFTSSIQEFAGKAALTYYVECDSAGLIDIYATKSAARTNLNTVVWNGAGFDSVTEADRTVLATYQEIIDARGTYDTLEHRLDDLVITIGKSGGQTIRGGTGASENLTLESTSNGTKGNIILSGKSGNTKGTVTIGAAATTFTISSNVMVVTGDVGGNTIATITGGVSGQILVLIFVDALVTITDDNSHAANTVDLNAAFVSADDTTLTLVYDGTSWYEIARSIN